MNDEQIKEVMRLADVIENLAWSAGKTEQYHDEPTDYAEKLPAARAALEAYLRTIGEPAGYSLPAGSMGAKKFAQVGGGFTPVGLVFSRGESAMAITEHGRVYWDRDLAHPNGSKPESVNAELLAIVRRTVGTIENTSIETGYCCCGDGMDGHASPLICGHSATDQGAYLAGLLYEDAKAAIARAESAIETPAKVSPCAGHAVKQEAELRQIVGIKEAIAGIHEFFDSECHSGITGIVDTSKVCGDRVEDECRPTFDHCYVNQGGCGITGYDFHGTVYFHIGNGEYATVDY